MERKYDKRIGIPIDLQEKLIEKRERLH